MVAATPIELIALIPEQRVVLSGISWRQYGDLLEALGDTRGTRLTYLDGELEIMSPSADHERVKKGFARMLEAWAVELGLDLRGFGSTTFRKRVKKTGAEPDECYILGPRPGMSEDKIDRPDLAVEITLRPFGVDKLAVYAGLEVPELWIWRAGKMVVYVLRGKTYREVARSKLLPDANLDRLLELAMNPNQTAATRALRAEMARRASPKRRSGVR